MPEALKQCECGCGSPVKPDVRRRTARFIRGHHRRVHGMRHTVEFGAYYNALQRCINPKRKEWKNYGGRGIKFLFTSFIEFFKELGKKPSPKHTLDRWPNNDGNYEPGKVRWATRIQQTHNRRPSNYLRSCTNEALLDELRRRNLIT